MKKLMAFWSENQQLREENLVLREQLRAAREDVARLKRETLTDDLTGLDNARSLRGSLERALSGMRRDGLAPALLFIDVDNFKEVNEVHGHEAGGALLRHVGRVVANCIRAEDLGFRYGGDEFVVLVSGGLETAQKVAERIRAKVAEQPFDARGLQGRRKIALTVSIGVRALRPGDTASDVLQEADRAMFEAKRGARNRVCLAA